ncbi:ParA family protein [Pelagibius litoralis]|uniref:ParA family protein n=1 Tax=Pelagibius litoralis TaxID=374515 RepID=A0A967EVL5_9PROT|nr:ParA family protein [Pelagibius litoralis]NIA68841.1 ParA family protein [Pelagibius litoralis]
MITILVANPKGGCGKTTVATHIAAAFANAGLRTALADADKQGSSLGWMKQRPSEAGPIQPLDWRDSWGKPPKAIDRLIIDSPAAMKMGKIDDLLRMADVVVVPVLPSGFDVAATGDFLKKLETLKPIRKSRTAVAVVRNRVQLGTRSAGRLDSFMIGVGHKGVGRLRHRTIYTEIAAQGLSIFDLSGKQYEDLRDDWAPLLRYIENSDPGINAFAGSR